LNVKNRWEEKKFKFERKEGKDITLLPVFFLEGRGSIPAGTARAQYICTINVHAAASGQSAMSDAVSGNLYGDDYRQDPGDTGSFSGSGMLSFVMAHEIGHALGNDDEYIYRFVNDPAGGSRFRLPRFEQYYKECHITQTRETR